MFSGLFAEYLATTAAPKETPYNITSSTLQRSISSLSCLSISSMLTLLFILSE